MTENPRIAAFRAAPLLVRAVLLAAAGSVLLASGALAQSSESAAERSRREEEQRELGRSTWDSPELEAPNMTYEQKARIAYEAGVDYLDSGRKYEEEAAAATGKKAEKKAAKAEKAFKKAASQFRRALDEVPIFPQGWNRLGYALLKLGDYEESVAAFDRAVEIAPQYSEAIAHRGEAYLGLDRLEEAKGAYVQLLQIDRNRAGELTVAMKRWLAERRSGAGGVSAETIEGFGAWIEERDEELVAQAGSD